MASPFAMDLGNVLGTVDAVRTARMQRENLLLQREHMQEDRQRAQQQETRLEGARSNALAGDRSQLFAIAPQEAMQIESHFFNMDTAKRQRALAEARENTDQMGRLAAYVLAAETPQERQRRYAQVRQNLPGELQQQMPAEYDEARVNFSLAQARDMDSLLNDIAQRKEGEAMRNVLSPQPGQMYGQQGGIRPTSNPTGLDEGIIAAVDTVSPLGNGLIQSESGGNFSARNNVQGAGGRGHFGRGQFSIGRMQDFTRATGRQFTPDEFMANPQLQAEVELWHRQDILSDAQRRGYAGAIGSSINGVPVTEQGIVNVAHLGGKEGAKRFFESGGRYDPADANGTRLSDYLALGAREQQQMQADPRNSPLAQPVMVAMSDPNVSQGARAVLADLYGRLAPQSAAAEPTSGMREYEFARQQGYEGSFEQWKQGQVPGTNVNVQTGNIPPGYQQITDPETGAIRMETIPGGPVEADQLGAAEKEAQRQRNTEMAGSTVIQDLQRALDILPELGLITRGEGVVGGIARTQAARIPGSLVNRITQFTESALSNVGLDTLQRMREASPTGGALGQVPIQQQQRLEQVLGSLRVDQPPPELEANIKRVINIYTDIIHGTAAERQEAVRQGMMAPEQAAEIDGYYYDLPFDSRGRSRDPSWSEGPQVGEVVEGYRYVGGDPGDPSSWERVR